MSDKELIELRRNKMGMVFQSFALLPHKTVLENIAFPLQVKGNSTKDSMQRAKDMVDLVGLTGRENYFPRQLSGGQQQRVGIARSLAVEPDIWFLDEPFSALDPLIRKEMQDEFLRLQGVLNKTILFVTHDFDEALRLADRIAIMKDGIIEQLDTPSNIVLNPATEYVRKFTEDVPREIPPQLVRIPELTFYHPVINTSATYVLIALMVTAGFLYKSFAESVNKSNWLRVNWFQIISKGFVGIIVGIFLSTSYLNFGRHQFTTQKLKTMKTMVEFDYLPELLALPYCF